MSNASASVPSTFSTSTEPLDTTVGLLLNGYILTMVLYGFIFFQSYVYYNRYPRDHWLFKLVVGLLVAMDTAAVATITESAHFYLIVQFLDTFAGVDNARPTYCADNGLATLAICMAQLGYVHRTWKLKHSAFASITAAVAAAGACALGLVMTARLSIHPSFDGLANNPGKAIMGVWQALTFISAAISFCQLCGYQAPIPTDAEKKGRIESTLDVFVNVGIERGAIATVFQLGYLVTFLVAPDKRYWIPFQLISRRLFVVSFITMLNSRHVVHGEGVYDATTSVGNTSTYTGGAGTRSITRSTNGVTVSTTTERFALSSEIAKATAASGNSTAADNNKVPMVTFETTSHDDGNVWDIHRSPSQEQIDEKGQPIIVPGEAC